jgi:tricorn protease interacting factor F2/3
LTIDPDLNRFTFTGRVAMDLNADQPTDTVTLDCAELAVWQCRMPTDKAAENSGDCPFMVDPANQRLTIHLGETISGPFQLTIDYAGKINDRMAGFYRSRIHVAGAPDYIAVTQFQESDARLAFPCFDHPAEKAVFRVAMLIDEGLTAISNADIETVEKLKNGRLKVSFHPTPKMSTYLLFFGVGPFEIHADSVDSRVRAVCLPGTASQTAFGVEFGRKALAYGEDYYAIDYPLTKLDLIAVPDFAFGAMENWGAITFRENLLLRVPGVTSREAEARICEVIAHEITHQWFGNLVTPEDWKYLWLNESFATYFAYSMVNHYYPQWDVWHQFVRSQTETALKRDALLENFAIEMPGGAKVAITTSTAPIIYSKGGSILRQLEAWIGPHNFKAGLRRYLTDFKYANAASHHLWESLTAESGMTVDALMRSWVTQAGFPMITAERKNNTLQLSQQRFTYLPNGAAQTWLVPLAVTRFSPDGKAHESTVLLDKDATDLSLPPDTAAYKVNAAQTGFYHVHYKDPDNLERLGVMASRRQLPPMDRWGLTNDLFAMVKAGHLSMTTFLNLVEKGGDERDYLPLSSLDSHLFEAFFVLRGPIRSRSARTAEELMNAFLSAVGLEPATDETQATAMLRDQILVHGALMGNQKVLEFLLDQFRAFTSGATIAADIFRGVMTAGAAAGGQAALKIMIDRIESSPAEHERMILAGALGAFGQGPLLEKALDYALDKIPDRIRFLPLTAAAGNPAVTARLWPWFEDHLPRLATMHPLLFERVVAAFVPGPGIEDPERTRAFCAGLVQQRPDLKDVIALSLERLDINAGFRRREQ